MGMGLEVLSVGQRLKKEVIVLCSLLFLGFHQEDHPRIIKYEVLVSYLWRGSASFPLPSYPEGSGVTTETPSFL